MSEQPMSGVTVLDLTHYIAGPFCTKLMAGMGAEVIKIEPPDNGDPARKLGPFPEDIPDPEKSGAFLYLNTGKKGITLNLKTASGVAIFKRLLNDAAIVIENFEPRVMPGLGLNYEELEKVNPKIVMTSISNFGQNGPYRDYKADEMVPLALGGLLYLMGDPEREPLRTGYAGAQYMGGLAGFTGTLGALSFAEATGTGQHVDVSLMECIAASHAQTEIEYIYTGLIGKRNRVILTFPCADGVIQIAMQPHHWPRLVQMMNMPELLEDPRFKSTDERARHAEELETLMLPWMVEHNMVDIYEAGQAVGLPIGYQATTEHLFSSKQLKARNYFIDIDHPRAGKLSYAGAPVRMGEIPWQNGRAPLLGEHNEEIYCGKLGYSREELVRLETLGII